MPAVFSFFDAGKRENGIVFRMELRLPSAEYKASFIEAVREYQEYPTHTFRDEKYRLLSTSELESDFDAFISREASNRRGENLPEGHVPCTDYWLIDNEEFIGRVSIRHHLNDALLRLGGHIGYDIRPGRRGRGYGNAILRLTLPKAKELGIKRALVTCDATNIASRKIIEKNGGVLENRVGNPETGIDKLRFWIALA